MSALDDAINATMLAITTRLQTLIVTGSATEVTLASKALEAVRGTSALQNILTQSQATLGTLSDNLADAQTALTGSKDTYLSALTTLKNTLSGNLNDLATALTADYLSGASAIGSPRIGDIHLSIIPDVSSLPSKCKICDGSYLALADADALVAAWGMGVGQTVTPFVTNYNASVSVGDRIILDGTGLRLPNFSSAFFKAGNPTQVGTYQQSSVGTHTHTAGTPSAIVTRPAGIGNGVNLITGAAFRLDSVAATDSNATGAENYPKNFSSVALVRYK